MLHWLLIYIYEIIHDIYLLLYVMSNQEFILFYLYFSHVFMCLLSVSGIYRLIQSCCCLHLQLIDGI